MTTPDPTPRACAAAPDLTGVDARQAAEIAKRNDALRRDRLGGHVVMTATVAALSPDLLNGAILALRRFDAFSADNDPYGEHDFGAFDHAGERFLFKIDTYADHTLTEGAEDPLAPTAVRVLTLMLASDY